MAFARVDQRHAGPSSLGILVPHGARTLVIVRPRALAWDLLPARWDGESGHAPEFCHFTRDEAAAAARKLVRDLENAVSQGNNPVQSFGDQAEKCMQIWVRTEELVWIVCRRAPGQAYQPMIFASRGEVESEAEKIAAVVWPAPASRQEYYFNTQNFAD